MASKRSPIYVQNFILPSIARAFCRCIVIMIWILSRNCFNIHFPQFQFVIPGKELHTRPMCKTRTFQKRIKEGFLHESSEFFPLSRNFNSSFSPLAHGNKIKWMIYDWKTRISAAFQVHFIPTYNCRDGCSLNDIIISIYFNLIINL